MADKTITDLNALTTPASTDVLAIVDVASNETKKIEVGNLVGGGGGGTNNVVLPYAFFDTQIRDVYLPLTSESDTLSRQRYNRFVAPFSGSLKAATFYGTVNLSGGTGFSLGIELMQAGSASNFTTIETQTAQGLTAYTATTLTFSSNSFSAGDVLYFRLNNGFSTAFGNMTGTLLFEVS